MKHRLNIVIAIFWATAMIAGALLKAPVFLTLVLLPLLATCSMAAIEMIVRREAGATSRC
jgi:hypothetical protein